MTRYIDDGPPIPVRHREEMLAASLPFELDVVSEWRDVGGVIHHEPVVARFETERAQRAWNHMSDDVGRTVIHIGDDSDPGDEDRR